MLTTVARASSRWRWRRVRMGVGRYRCDDHLSTSKQDCPVIQPLLLFPLSHSIIDWSRIGVSKQRRRAKNSNLPPSRRTPVASRLLTSSTSPP